MKVSYADIMECCVEISNVVSKMNDIISEIQSSASSLQNSVWMSPASDNYCGKLQNLLSNFESISTYIEHQVSSISKSVENYKGADTKVTGGGGGGMSSLNSFSRKDITVNHVF